MQMMLPGASDVIQHGALFLDFFHFFEYIFSFPCKKKRFSKKMHFSTKQTCKRCFNSEYHYAASQLRLA